MMTDEQFDAQLQVIQDQAQANLVAVIAWRDQQMATLFLKSEWTQERLAERLGKTRQWIAYRVRFAHFLDFATTVANCKTPRNLTERKFRGYWEATSGRDERKRFREVAEAMEGDFVLSKPKAPVADKILSQYADWKWRTVKEMADGAGEDYERVEWAMNSFRNHHNVRIESANERKKDADGQSLRKYRFKRLPKISVKTSAVELADQIEPICKEGLKLTRDSNKIEYSRMMTAGLFDRILKLVRAILGSETVSRK